MTLPKVTRSGSPSLDRAVEPPLAARGRPEAGHHLVADEEGAVPCAGLGEERVEPGLRRDHPHVARRRLGDQAGDPVAVLGEHLLDRSPVVVGQHEGQGRRGLRDAGGAGHGERGEARPGRGQQRVDVAVVAAGELHDQVPPGEAAGQPDRGHGGLGARRHEPDPLDGGPGHDLLGELDLGRGRGAVRRAAGDRLGDCCEHLGVGVAEQHRTPGADQVDVVVAVDVGQPRAPGGPDEPGGPAHGVEGADRGVHPARRHRAGAVEPGGGGGVVGRVVGWHRLILPDRTSHAGGRSRLGPRRWSRQFCRKVRFTFMTCGNGSTTCPEARWDLRHTREPDVTSRDNIRWISTSV